MVPTSLKDSPFIKCLRQEPTPYTPVWLMRQAGRYQKEYRDIRARVGFLELCKNPDLASEVTVMAVEQLGVDAGIIFADILLPLEPMGLGLRFAQGDGPVLDNPIRTLHDVDSLKPVDPQQDLSYVLDAIAITSKALAERVPLIGFAGAPFTLASYAVEGGSSRNYEKTKVLMYSETATWHKLMTALTDMTIAYLKAQAAAGASALQIFDSWVGSLSPFDYERFVLPYMQDLTRALKGVAPLIYFGTMTGGILHLMAKTDADVIGVDWRCDIDTAWQAIGAKGIQGNLDPLVLLSNKSEIRRQATEILEKVSDRPGHVFNLGHGILPSTPPENARFLVDLVHECTRR